MAALLRAPVLPAVLQGLTEKKVYYDDEPLVDIILCRHLTILLWALPQAALVVGK